MVKQKFKATVDEQEIIISYKYSCFSGKTELIVDGDRFVVRGNLFGIGVCRRENIMVGGAVAIIDINKRGKAKIILRDGKVEEI